MRPFVRHWKSKRNTTTPRDYYLYLGLSPRKRGIYVYCQRHSWLIGVR